MAPGGYRIETTVPLHLHLSFHLQTAERQREPPRRRDQLAYESDSIARLFAESSRCAPALRGARCHLGPIRRLVQIGFDPCFQLHQLVVRQNRLQQALLVGVQLVAAVQDVHGSALAVEAGSIE